MTDLAPVRDFLGCETPDAWLEASVAAQPVLLVDHANCEKKAAATALNLLFRYVDRSTLLDKLSRLAREELRHFEQVLALMARRNVPYTPLSASRYASRLREGVRDREPGRLVDTLVVGAFIEARSCERFAALAPRLDTELANFYRSLLKSEARHFEDYLRLAAQYADEPLEARVAAFREREAALITSPDPDFRFHSGVPV